MLSRGIRAARPLSRSLRPTTRLAASLPRPQVRYASRADIEDPDMVSIPDHLARPQLTLRRLAVMRILLRSSDNTVIHTPTGGTSKSVVTLVSLFTKITTFLAFSPQKTTHISRLRGGPFCSAVLWEAFLFSWASYTKPILTGQVHPGPFQAASRRNSVGRMPSS